MRVPEPLTRRPDVLVLAAGGTLGEAWMRGLLDGAGAATGIDFRDCEYFVGTSAGSIVAAFLAAGREPDSGAEARAARDWGAAADEAGNGAAGPAPDDAEGGPFAALGRLGLTAAAPFAPLALASAAPGGAVARAAALAAVPRPKRSMPGLGRLVEESGAEFDGRLRIAAVDRRSGKRVVFGAPGSPPATVAQAVLASCSIPWVFAPVEIDGREYVDGGVWSTTNLDATPARRGTEVLCLNPLASLGTNRSALGALRAVSQSAAVTETLALKARGASVRTIAPGPPCRRDHGREPDGPRPRRRGARGGLRPGPLARRLDDFWEAPLYPSQLGFDFAETRRESKRGQDERLSALVDDHARRARGGLVPGRRGRAGSRHGGLAAGAARPHGRRVRPGSRRARRGAAEVRAHAVRRDPPRQALLGGRIAGRHDRDLPGLLGHQDVRGDALRDGRLPEHAALRRGPGDRLDPAGRARRDQPAGEARTRAGDGLHERRPEPARRARGATTPPATARSTAWSA